MKKIVALSFIFAMIAIITQCAMALDKYSIYVYDKDGYTVKDAIVTVLDGNNRVATGSTDSDGLFEAWLNSGISYRITATLRGQFGSRQGYLPNGYRVEIHMK
jgi:hypothetical protein